MADIDFYADINDDNPEDGFGLDDSLENEDNYGTDDKLTPLQKLEKYMQSDNVYTRQMVARGLLDTLRAVDENEEESTAVLNAMVRLSEDSDPIVRSELMEQVPHIAVYCHEDSSTFPNAVPLYVLPMVVRYLNDPHNQVRKTSQAALLVLLEQELIGKADIEEQVVNVILDLACPDSLDDYRTEAVALMSKMAPLLGKEMTERLFLPRYCEMCTDPLFHVRKVCAANFGDICTVVGQGNTEQQLLPKFYYLCEDGVWGVRKACAECFMAVSCACSPDVRRGELSTLFVNLLCDLSRWVRMAAFQQLGPFISTFADPCITGLYVSDDGILCVQNPEKLYALENFERLRDLGEQLGGEALCVEEETRNKDAEESTNSGFLNDSECQIEPNLDCDNTTEIEAEPMDLTESNSEQEVLVVSKVCDSTLPDGPEISQEEKRAEVYIKNEIAEVENQEQNTNSQVTDSDDISTNKQNVTGENELLSSNSSCVEDSVDKVSDSNTSVSNSESSACDNENSIQKEPSSAGSEEGEKPEVVHIHLDNVGNFNSFQYWRTPLPEIDVDFDIVNGAAQNFHVTAKVKDEEHHKIYATEMNVIMPPSSSANLTSSSNTVSSSDSLLSDMTNVTLGDKTVISSSQAVIEELGIKIHTANVNTVSETGETVDNIGSTHVLGQQLNETTMKVVDGVVQDFNSGFIDSNLLLSLLPIADVSGNSLGYIDDSLRDSIESVDEAKLAQQQDIVPQSLLESYLGMVDPSRAQTVDTEITRYCAYNLPAVAYTLGRKNWNCIKSLYEVLATDMQWKVRRTLAFSIHEMALILGEDITHRDLVPVFDGFLKDLDEVRIGVLKHLADFLRLLRPDIRKQYLGKVEGFMNTDNHRNWRFRLELADQLMLISELYSAEEVSQCLLPLGLMLAEDKVAEVRLTAFRLLSVMLRRLSREGDQLLAKRLMMELVEKFAESNKWAKRQIFAQLVQCILEEDAVGLEIFTKEIVPSLLSLSHDSVPNVRIALAKTMSRHLFTREYFTSPKNPMYEQMCKTLQNLQCDSDRDVRYFSHPQPEYTCMEDDEDLEEEKLADVNQVGDTNTLPV